MTDSQVWAQVKALLGQTTISGKKYLSAPVPGAWRKAIAAGDAQWAAVTTPPPPPGSFNTVQNVLDAMGKPSEGQPQGFAFVPPALSYNKPPPEAGFLSGWGQIFVEKGAAIPANVRIEVKNFESYVWSLTQQKWVAVQATRTWPPLGGAYYKYGFATLVPVTTVLRQEPDGGFSVPVPPAGYLWHYWPVTHAPIVPADVGAVFTTHQARLILDNPSGPDNLASARYLGDSGGDFWQAKGTPINGHTNVGVGFGRFEYITAQWKALNFYTGGPPSVMASGHSPADHAAAWTEAQLIASRPPLDGMGAP